jgi:hypothetical protein
MLRILTPATALAVAAVLLAGCGGSNHNGNGGSAAASSSSRANADLKMAQCMRANGVPSFPDPSSNGGPGGGFSIQGGSNGTVTIGGATVTQSTLRAAFQKCRKELPQGPPISSAQLTKLRQGALKMAQCMRAHGVQNFPDPQIATGPGGHGIGIRIGVGPNGAGGNTAGPGKAPLFSQTPAFRSAAKVCMPLIRNALGKAPRP